LLVHAGLFRPDRLTYVDPLAAPFDGTFNLTLKGSADKPISIKAAGDGEVIFDGAGNHANIMAPLTISSTALPRTMLRCSPGRRNLPVRRI
jgi:hypothetical protein